MMDARAPTSPPYFDPVALRAELTAIFRDHDEEAQSARNPIAARLKQLVKDARNDARLQLESDGNGRRCAAGLSKFQDELVHLIYDYTVAHVYRLSNPTSSERVAVIATGGYGRGLLAPGSDIDLRFELPSKQTPWGESVVEFVLDMLWDLGFKVGHATRTIDQCIKLALADMTIRTSLLDARLIFGDARSLCGTHAALQAATSSPGTAKEFIAAKMAERDPAPHPFGVLPLQGRAEHQGRQRRLARSAHTALARDVSLWNGTRHRRPAARHLHACRARDVSSMRNVSSGPYAAICIS